MSLYELSSILFSVVSGSKLGPLVIVILAPQKPAYTCDRARFFFWGGGAGGLVPYFCMHSIISRHTSPAPADPLQASIIIPFYNIYSCLFILN